MEKRKYENVYLPEGYLLGTEMNRTYTSSLKMLECAMKRGKILEGTVSLCDCTDMTLHIDFGFARGIIPKGEALYSPDGGKDIAVITRVGKAVCFKVTDILPGDFPTVILSRRAAQEECTENYIKNLVPGDIIPACVTHLDPFGAFVDIGCGIVSLICIDCISVSRIFHPSDRLTVGEKIYAAVKSTDRETGRIYMTLRELLGTWEENASEFSPGSTVAGIVRSVEDYGIFVELSPNLAGLAELRDGVSPGDVCSVYIKSIIPARMKIKLVLIDFRPGAKTPPPPLKYYVDAARTSHLDRWKYSPEGCAKTVETVF
ncbi:MAG: S1 RNA-binding domain-containing protein [Clostridia bacterium]|nr:S1 RNA-binding domain-containing protein [Clostridia bacterium]